jgi:hypothetical protein
MSCSFWETVCQPNPCLFRQHSLPWMLGQGTSPGLLLSKSLLPAREQSLLVTFVAGQGFQVQQSGCCKQVCWALLCP